MFGDFLEHIVQQKVKQLITQQITKWASGTDTAIHDVIGTLLWWLSKNTKLPSWADALAAALDKDHDGSILDDLGDLMQNSPMGERIMTHILGSQRTRIEAAIAQKTWLPAETVSQLYNLLAPLVMGKLWQEKKIQWRSSWQLADLLQKESSEVQQDSQLQPLLALLDTDGDGDIDLQDFL